MKKLTIPERISLRWELTPGIGTKELRRIFIAAAFGAVAAFIYARTSAAPGALLGAVVGYLIYFAACWGLFIRQSNEQSIYDYLVLRWWFHREQQTYYYKRRKERVKYYANQEPGDK